MIEEREKTKKKNKPAKKKTRRRRRSESKVIRVFLIFYQKTGQNFNYTKNWTKKIQTCNDVDMTPKNPIYDPYHFKLQDWQRPNTHNKLDSTSSLLEGNTCPFSVFLPVPLEFNTCPLLGTGALGSAEKKEKISVPWKIVKFIRKWVWTWILKRIWIF